MSATTEALTEPRPFEPSAPPPALIVAALTRAEGRRLLNHPVFLCGVGLSVVAAAGWHLLYLTALGILAAVLALSRNSPRRRLLWAGSLALAALTAAALPQLFS